MPALLRDLRLSQFRCFEDLTFHPGPARTLIVGRNAQGKTSILEAACVLLRLQSPRTTTLSEAVRIGSSGFGLDGHHGDVHLTCHWENGQRRISLDGKIQSGTADYLGTARVAWFANSDLDLVRGGGSGRRRYLDFLGLQSIPGYRSALRSYERALRSRNALLKDGSPRREIAAFDALIAEHGDQLLAFRSVLCETLSPLARIACHEISGEADLLEIHYQPGADGPMAQALAAAWSTDERLRQTTVGPHRDDVRLMLNGMEAAAFASEGQQRSIAIALKLAQARALQASQGTPPLFLLDDVFGELDPFRRNRLLAALPEESQALITTTFLDWAGDTARDTVFELSDGRLTPRLVRA